MINGKFGFGIIGAGMIAHVHAKAIGAIGNATLVGLHSRGNEKMQAFAAQHSCKAFNTLEEMLADPAIDIVCVCTPSGAHEDPTLHCLQAGKHCLVEKPLEVTLEKCDSIIEASRMTGMKVGVIFPSRFYDQALLLKKAMDTDKFGDIVLGDAYVKWHRSEAYYKSNPWRGTIALDGGGALMNQASHYIDLLDWLMGPVESVMTYTATLARDIEVEDSGVVALRWRSGTLGTVNVSMLTYPKNLEGSITILGDKGTVKIGGIAVNEIQTWKFEVQRDYDVDIQSANYQTT